MKRWITICTAALAACALAFATARAHGVDCQLPIEDWGDAPECIPAYPTGVIGHFPTCFALCAPGTQELQCVAISSPPGPTGFMHNVTPAAAPHIWLGCYPVPTGGLGGLDGEPDGKVNTPTVGTSACLSGMPTDCVESAFGGAMTFDQDECVTDPIDHGVDGPLSFPFCGMYAIKYNTGSCGPSSVQAFLNILVDWNQDGDWNDALVCQTSGTLSCAYEWAVKNAPIVVPPGCGTLLSPPFVTGPQTGPTWFRVSITLEPVNADYPWAGSATTPSGFYLGGETEDYPASIEPPVPTHSQTWGSVKSTYR